MSQSFTMKHQPILYAFCAALALYPLTVLILHIGSTLQPHYTWSDIASDWGAIFAGGVALLGAWMTVAKMNQQMQQNRIDDDRKAALEYAAYLRSSAAVLRTQLTDFATRAALFAIHFKKLEPNDVIHAEACQKANEFIPSEREKAYTTNYARLKFRAFEEKVNRMEPLRSVEAVHVGFMPTDIRHKVINAVQALRLNSEQLNMPMVTANSLEKRFSKTLNRWRKYEFETITALMAMEVLARELCEKESLYVELGAEPFDPAEVAKSEGMVLVFPTLLEHFGIKPEWTENDKVFVQAIPKLKKKHLPLVGA